MGGGSRHSLFSQRFDRAVLASYFLGGIVPIAALFYVVNEYVLPRYAPESSAFLGWIGGVGSLAVLSLAVYFALRRISNAALARVGADNQRLASLLTASRELGAARDQAGIFASASARARELSGASSVAVLLASEPDKPLELRHADADSRSWFQANVEDLLALAGEAEGGAGVSANAARLAISFRASAGLRGALVLQHGGALSAETSDALATVAGMVGSALQRSDLEDAQRNFFAHVTELLVTGLDGHVVGRRGHGSNVARFANRVAHEIGRSEERRVGKECRSRWSPYH